MPRKKELTLAMIPKQLPSQKKRVDNIMNRLLKTMNGKLRKDKVQRIVSSKIEVDAMDFPWVYERICEATGQTKPEIIYEGSYFYFYVITPGLQNK